MIDYIWFQDGGKVNSQTITEVSIPKMSQAMLMKYLPRHCHKQCRWSIYLDFVRNNVAKVSTPTLSETMSLKYLLWNCQQCLDLQFLYQHYSNLKRCSHWPAVLSCYNSLTAIGKWRRQTPGSMCQASNNAVNYPKLPDISRKQNGVIASWNYEHIAGWNMQTTSFCHLSCFNQFVNKPRNSEGSFTFPAYRDCRFSLPVGGWEADWFVSMLTIAWSSSTVHNAMTNYWMF